MAFLVEDGTGLAAANSYASVAFADGYFADRGNAAWAALAVADKESALVRGTDYLDTRFGSAYIGYQAFANVQALGFPRVAVNPIVPTFAFAQDAFPYGYIGGPVVSILPQSVTTGPVAIPVNLLKACCEYAVRSVTAPLAPDPIVDPTGYKPYRTMTRVGPLETRVDYTERGADTARQVLKPYPAADMLMRPLVTSIQGRVGR